MPSSLISLAQHESANLQRHICVHTLQHGEQADAARLIGGRHAGAHYMYIEQPRECTDCERSGESAALTSEPSLGMPQGQTWGGCSRRPSSHAVTPALGDSSGAES